MTRPVALLFWFYRDPLLCRNRLELLRRDNPDAQIFGVFGGDPRDAPEFQDSLAPLLDDFWTFERDVPSKWKWQHGDVMLADWYAQRGHKFTWEHVFVAQWDMLVLESVADLLPALGGDDVLLSGVRPVAALADTWVWVRGGHAATYQKFVAAIEAQFGAVEPMSCVFVVACLPRRLLAAYADLDEAEVGFVEYRVPTLAAALGLRLVADDRFRAWRPADTEAGKPTRRQRYLNGSRRTVLLPTVLAERARRGGARVFHPYHGLYPLTVRWAARSPMWTASSGLRLLREKIGR